MATSDVTCWTVIRGAAAGRGDDRAEFARRYEVVIRSYLAARWRGSPLVGEIDDATQEVFLDCFREEGALGRADPARPFRAFLFGVTRNVARRTEEARARAGPPLASDFDAPGREEAPSAAFDRAWASALLKQAAARQRENAEGDERALRRVEMLRRRFQSDEPIRALAAEWGVDAAFLHHEYATARREFYAALQAVVEEHHPGSPDTVDAECRRLLACFS